MYAKKDHYCVLALWERRLNWFYGQYLCNFHMWWIERLRVFLEKKRMFVPFFSSVSCTWRSVAEQSSSMHLYIQGGKCNARITCHCVLRDLYSIYVGWMQWMHSTPTTRWWVRFLVHHEIITGASFWSILTKYIEFVDSIGSWFVSNFVWSENNVLFAYSLMGVNLPID